MRGTRYAAAPVTEVANASKDVGALDECGAALSLVPDVALERRQQAKIRVHRLEMLRITRMHVSEEGTEHGVGRRNHRVLACQQACEVDPREQARCQGFGVAFHADQLSRKEHERVVTQRQMRRQRRRCVYVGIPVDRPEAIELCRLQSGKCSEYPALFRYAKPCLEPDEIPHLSSPILAS